MPNEIGITIVYGHEDMHTRRKDMLVPQGTTMGQVAQIIGSDLGIFEMKGSRRWENNEVEVRQDAVYLASIHADIADVLEKLENPVMVPLSYQAIHSKLRH